MALMLSVHPSRQKDLLTEHRVQLLNEIASHDYRDAFGNICTRLVAPPGLLEIRNDFVIADSGLPDEVVPDAPQWDVAALPDETLLYLLGSRYCDTEKLSDSHGPNSAALMGAGSARKRSATTCITTSSLVTTMPGATAPRPRDMPSVSGFAGTLPTLLSRCVAA